MKLCSKCKTEKKPSEFAKDRRHRDGLQSHCRECNNKGVRKHRTDNPELKAIADKKYYEKNKKEILKNQKAYASQPLVRAKHNVRGATYRAVQKGELTKSMCGCGEPSVEAHHPDYTKPLEVVWMCVKCHHKLHKMNLREVMGD